MSLDENKNVIRRLIEEAMNAGNLDLVPASFAPDYVAHVPGVPGLPTGPAAFQRVVQMWRSTFPDWHMAIEALVAEGDLVANRFTTTGTHRGPLMGIPPTGRPITVKGMEFHRLRDGKVAESWISDDLPGILVQLGILKMPFPGPPAGAPR